MDLIFEGYQEPSQGKSQESYSEWALRNLKSAGQRAGSIAETIATLPSEAVPYSFDLYKYLTGEESPNAKTLRESGVDIGHRTPYFQPEPARGFGEEVLQGTLSQLPFVALTGGVGALKGAGQGLASYLTGGAARTVAGNVAAAGTKEAGFSPLVQAGAQFLTEGAFGAATRPGLRAKAAQAIEPISEPKSYGTASSAPLAKPQKAINFMYDSQVDEASKKALRGLSEAMSSAAAGEGKVDLRKLLDVRTSLYGNYDTYKKLGLEAIFTQSTKAINNVLKGEQTKLASPAFWNALTEHDQLKIAANVGTTITNGIQKTLGRVIPTLPFKVKETLIDLTGILRTPERLVGRMANKDWRSHAFKLATASAEGKKSDIIKYAKQLENIRGEEGEEYILESL